VDRISGYLRDQRRRKRGQKREIDHAPGRVPLDIIQGEGTRVEIGLEKENPT